MGDPLMAVSKKRARLTKDGEPDPAPFVRVIDDGLAEPRVVAQAYLQAYGQWIEAGGDPSGDVVQERPEVDPTDPGSRLIQILREAQFKGATKSLPTIQEVK
jgi:hypothetical protein